jgi:hypothetical protein
VSLSSLVTGSQVTPIASSITDGVLGKVGVYMTDAQTSSLAPGSYRWSMKWTAPSGDVRSALGGIWEIVR